MKISTNYFLQLRDSFLLLTTRYIGPVFSKYIKDFVVTLVKVLAVTHPRETLPTITQLWKKFYRTADHSIGYHDITG